MNIDNKSLLEEIEELKSKVRKSEERIEMIENILRKHHEDDMF